MGLCIIDTCNLSKPKNKKIIWQSFLNDVAKIIFAIMVIGPLAKPESFHFFIFTGGFKENK